MAIPFNLVTFCRQEDETWEVAVDYSVIERIKETKGANEIWIWPLFGDFKK